MRGDQGFPVRLRFAKRGKVRFISHRDVARAFERAFRVEELPLAFTAGFVPRPKVSFGLALSVGHESDAEYLDVELAEAVDLDRWPDTLSAALPEGITVTGVVALTERAPALQEAVTAVEYRVGVAGADRAEVSGAVERALSRPTLETTRTRKGREVVEDVRPALRAMTVGRPSNDSDDDGRVVVDLELSTQPRGTRPTEILAAVGEHLTAGRVLRTHQWIERAGARLEPLEADARMRVPEARAS
ncbi:MAG: TIGR03936 family radical SAM-associated protein [Actinomycetota bacterium]